MKKYVCTICGYIYDEQKEGVLFSALPANWACPICGATKIDFKEVAETKAKEPVVAKAKVYSDKALTNAELNVLCTNLAKGCEKQYKAEETALFLEIADYYKKHSEQANESSFDNINNLLNEDLQTNFANCFAEAKENADRGALRVLTWSEKVSKIVASLIGRYKKEGVAFLQNSKIFVCEICGFIYIGDEAPEICPICKVPKFKIHEVGRV
ncbi:MAG: rubredoxin [Clostridia bacterium]